MKTRIWIAGCLFALTTVLGQQAAKADELGAFLQGLGQAVGGQGQHGGWNGQQRTQNNWVTTQPRYRDVYGPRHVRVQDGYEHQVNPGAIVADVLGAVGEGLRDNRGSLESYPEERRPRTRYV